MAGAGGRRRLTGMSTTMPEASDPEAFGCDRCWPACADEAEIARRALRWSARLIEEPHFSVGLRECPACAQRFVSVFTETVDFVGGEDPQHTVLMPLTEAEAAALVALGDRVTEGALEAIGAGRRSFHRDWPSDREATNAWGRGLRVGPHH